MTQELKWHGWSDSDMPDLEGYYAKVEDDNGMQIAEYTIKIYRAKGHLYLQHTKRLSDGSWPMYGGEYLLEDIRRWTLCWAKEVADKHFKKNYLKSERNEQN